MLYAHIFDKGNYPSLSCTRTAEGSTQTCQQLAAASAFHSKRKDNDGDNAWGVYSKYYKRYYARIKRGALAAATFKQWQEDAARMRDDCLDGKLTLELAGPVLYKTHRDRVK